MKLYSEIIDEFNKATTKAERIAVLQKNDSKHFREFMVGMFNENVKFDVVMPNTYKPSLEPAGLNFTYLQMEMDKMYRFVVNHPKRDPNLSDKKKTQLMQVILESLHKDEARLMVSLVNKKLDVKYLTPTLVKEAYSGINI